MNEKLTAYALHELPPDERTALEAQMLSDPALAAEAAEAKAFCAMLNEHIAQPNADSLTADQRLALMKSFGASAPQPRNILRPFWRHPVFVSTTAVAACVTFLMVKHYDIDLPSREVEADGRSMELVLGETPKPQPKPAHPDVLAKNQPAPTKISNSSSPIVLPDISDNERKKEVASAKAMDAAQKMKMASNERADHDRLSAVVTPASTTRKLDNSSAAGPTTALPQNAPATPSLAIGGALNQPTFSGELAVPKEMKPTGTLSLDQSPTIIKSGSGVWTLNEANSFSGVTTVNAGVLSGVGDQPMTAQPQPFAANRLDGSAGVPVMGKGVAAVNASDVIEPIFTKAVTFGTVSGVVTGTAGSMTPTDAGTLVLNSKVTKGDSAAAPGEAEKAKAVNSLAFAEAPTLSRNAGAAMAVTSGGLIASTDNSSGSQLSTDAPHPTPGATRSQTLATGIEGLQKDSRITTKSATRAPSAELAAYAPSPTPEPSEPQQDKSKATMSGSLSPASATSPAPSPSGTATYRPIIENPFTYVTQEPLSTFSTDVDTASYANVRRFLNHGQRPPADAVRLEELINYFPYSYEPPAGDKPFSVQVDLAEAPWQPLHRLARIALKGREIHEERQAANFVFLLDVSGSMSPSERLPLIKQSLRLLVEQLREDDHVSIVTYAGQSGVALPSTSGAEKQKIMTVIDSLQTGGSTNGASGINLAYEQALLNFKKGSINRVILCTDGDFNVGTNNVKDLEKLIAEKAKTGVFLSLLGVGTDNLKDHIMQTLADRGNGNYHYLDSLSEARKVLVEQMGGTLITIAKDVKIQVEFNPAQVAAYRLIGYEKRMLAKQDFNDDKKDAGEIGAGHTITALYEIVPASLKYPDGKPLVDELKYQSNKATGTETPSLKEPQSAIQNPQSAMELMTVKLRYKAPDGEKSQLIEQPVTDAGKKLTESPKDFQFAVSVAGFGMLLRDSQQRGELTWDLVRQLALKGKGEDPQGYRGEFLQLLDKARGLCESGR